jgi:hypothetical protein
LGGAQRAELVRRGEQFQFGGQSGLHHLDSTSTRNEYSRGRGNASSPWLKPGDSALALVEPVCNARDKTLTLRIDDAPAAHASCALPRDFTLTGIVEDQGMWHMVTAKSLVHQLSGNGSVEVDGVALPGTKTQ